MTAPNFEPPEDDTEFGGSGGMIQPLERKARTLPGHQELWEINARKKSRDPARSPGPQDVTTIPVPKRPEEAEES